MRGTEHNYDEGHEPVLRRILHRIAMWPDPDKQLPQPVDRRTGAGRKSSVYFVFIPAGRGGGGSGRYLVAKFDEEERRHQEWRALRNLAKIDTSPGMLLPIPGNEPTDEAIVFQAAQGVVGHLRCMDLLEVLLRQIEHNPGNCAHALELAVEILGKFYDAEPGQARFAREGRLATWADEFELVGQHGRSLIAKLIATAGRYWPEVDWQVDNTFDISMAGGFRRELPNPFVFAQQFRNRPTGRVMLSRIHGDLNLGNILIALGADMRPEHAFIIDFTNCTNDRIQAVDFSRLETEIWRHVLPSSVPPGGNRDLLRSYIHLRDYLDGRVFELGEASALISGLEFVLNRLRELAQMRLSPDLRRGHKYMFEDYFVSILLTSLSLLKHDDVAKNPPVARVLLTSAALAAEYLEELAAGKYAPGAIEFRFAPPRIGGTTRREAQQPATQDLKHRPRGRLPPPPGLVVGRDDDIEAVTEKLLHLRERGSRAVVLQGWPGVGKTTVARMIAESKSVAEFFPGGVVWVTAREVGTAEVALDQCIQRISPGYETEGLNQRELMELLRGLMEDRRMLIVVDDIWTSADGLPIKRTLSSGSRALFTTRSRQVVREMETTPGKESYRLGVLSIDDGFKLLEALAPSVVRKHASITRRLVSDLEGLPLALQVAGRLLAEEEALGLDVTSLFGEIWESHRLLEEKAPEDRFDPTTGTTPTVQLLFSHSTDRLQPGDRLRFAFLGSFAPKPAIFDLDFLSAVWNAEDPSPTVRRFADLGLVEPGPEPGLFQIHSLLVAHARSLQERL